ncbi:MAG: hypothetical protein WAK33_05655 [Silvibacterium sp.]|jgi:hypothetical protein
MNGFKCLALLGVAGICFTASTFKTQAQVTVNIGAEPACPYGYYDYAPYDCSPTGYYGPEWFTGGVFIGAGPWFHGPSTFHGNVDNHFDPQQGYKGSVPKRGDKAETPKNGGKAPTEFKGNEVRDGRGNTGDAKH